ncbi:MAG: sterol carrier family protein [Bifidobacteriaceae bacterium]|jgi:hypothetical protein|nr:sterol carrier family protein [Bifidobacteriaceae bacterium]
MASRRRIAVADGQSAIVAWLTSLDSLDSQATAITNTPNQPDRAVLATATRYGLEELAARQPGNAVEVRVPPFGAVQAVRGPRHTRGTPPNVVEMSAPTWLALITGRLTWTQALSDRLVSASGSRAEELATQLPLWQVTKAVADATPALQNAESPEQAV